MNELAHKSTLIYLGKNSDVNTALVYSCNTNEPKEYTNTWQITEVSNSTKRHEDNSGNPAEL